MIVQKYLSGVFTKLIGGWISGPWSYLMFFLSTVRQHHDSIRDKLLLKISDRMYEKCMFEKIRHVVQGVGRIGGSRGTCWANKPD